ncbi:MAG: hypothetical protein ACKO1I_03545, partial [Microcystis aeruginosa]
MVCTECHGSPSNGNCGLSRTYNLRYEDYPSNITLTDYSLVDDPCHDFCQQARNNVKTVAQFIDDNFNESLKLDRYEAIINVGRISGSYEPAVWNLKNRQALF